MATLVEYLLNTHRPWVQSPAAHNPDNGALLLCQYMGGGGRRIGSSGSSWLYIEFEANMVYMRPYL